MPLTNDEIEEIKRILGREPTVEELAMFEAQWSEHCSYKSSRLLLRLLPTKAKHVVLGPGRDAPAVEVFPDVLVVFKIESHNHPSAVDPYNGAATGIGGIVRDILTLGAKPIALLDLLYMGNPRDPHANWLIRGIVKGISDYGNRIGIPTVAGDTWFDEAFNKQPLVNVACVGIVSPDKAVLSGPKSGDLILIIGNATGRDGLLGSSFASRPLAEDVDKDIGAVQVGDPLTEKLLIDVIQILVEKNLVNYIKDLGGGGLTTALSESAADHGLGAVIYLDKLHTRQSLTPLELLVSESQERMLLAVPPTKIEDVKNILEGYEVPYSIIGYFDDSGIIKVFYMDRKVVEAPAKELAKPRAIRRPSKPPTEALKGFEPIILPDTEIDIEKTILLLLSSPNIASKKWIYEQYDHEVGARTIIKPGYGDAAVLRLLDGSRRGIAVKGDANPRYTYLDPFNGAANVVSECYRNLTAVGSTPLAIVDELNAGNPEKPEHYWYFEEMLKGLAWISDELGLPIVGGKVSFYNEDSRGVQVKPTLTVVGVGRIDDISYARGMGFREYGSYIVVIGTTYPEIGGTEYLYRVHGIEHGEIPKPRPTYEISHGNIVRRLIHRDIALSVHDIGLGGLGIALIEMAIVSGIGFDVDLSVIPMRAVDRLDVLLFSETQARYIIEIDGRRLDEAKKILDESSVVYSVIGVTKGYEKTVFRYNGNVVASIDLINAVDIYMNSLERELEVV
ncbi:phosphoribosylformylglycinamidine synthase II [Ignisphaera aggregans DSM 17230]|uniref:Phosphoribosylformylglycinamidine synthase subunit PurL n=1 Tax=Ignisphaera aggregans (strain DSM 17230 / JCM 13409 / AQ1.S1) TaxID=583356 RepID=E0SQN9_IGNAA|nr:phosphoribosylformylglycinamidine synthase II [Ignisphaera aggregans DSM 17230]